MLYREIIVVCSEIHTKHINTVWAERKIVGIFNFLLHHVTSRLYRDNVVHTTDAKRNNASLIAD